MNNLIKSSLINNKTLKVISLLLGIATWSLLNRYQTISKWIEVPVCFYNIPINMKVCAQCEKINIQVRGKLADITDCSNIGLHIDATHFKPGKQRIHPCDQQLFLPNSVKLLHNKPLFLEISTIVT